jgi:hypothetical protein
MAFLAIGQISKLPRKIWEFVGRSYGQVGVDLPDFNDDLLAGP